jgi:uncharacterized integral membrane protein (TIGR00697 family)
MNEATGMPHYRFIIPIAMLFVTDLIASNLTAEKAMVLGWLTMPGGSLAFPISYIFGNIITEVYGYKWSRLLIWIAVACNILLVMYISLIIKMPSAPFWHQQEAFSQILGAVPRVVFASALSYLCGEFVNSYLISRLKILTQGRHLWFRAITSTSVGVGVDSLVFLPIVFWGQIQLMDLVHMALSLYIFKIGYEIVALPITYSIVKYLKRKEGVDVYDYHTRYTPFTLDLRYKNVMAM